MAPMVQKKPKLTGNKISAGMAVEDDKDSNGSDADLSFRDEGTEAVPDEAPLLLEEDCDELGNHPPDR